METENKKMRKAAPFLVAAAAVLWGILVIYVRKLGAAGFSAMDIVCIRSYGSVFFLFPGLFLLGRKTGRSFLGVKRKDCWCFVGTGIFSIVFFSYCYFKNVEISTAAFSSILMYTSPVWVMLMSVVCFRERIGKRKAVALALAFLGCVLVSGITSGIGNVSVQGILLGLGSGVGYGLYTIFGQYALNRKYHPVTVTAYTFLFACAGVLPFVSAADIFGRFAASPPLLLWGLSMAFFSTTLSFSLYTLGLRYLEPGKAAVLAVLEPIVSALVGVLYYKEKMTFAMFVGIVLVLAASVIVSGNREDMDNVLLFVKNAPQDLYGKAREFLAKRKNRYFLAMAVCVLVLAVSALDIVGYYRKREEQQRRYEQLEMEARQAQQLLEERRRAQQIEAAEKAALEAKEEAKRAEEIRKHTCPYDFELLTRTNPDIYAWIVFEATQIDYPILQNAQDNYYLNRNLDLSYGYPGCIYSNREDARDFSDQMTVLYGHNMRNGVMFGSLDELRTMEFEKEEDRMIYTYEPGQMQKWELYAAVEFSDVYLPNDYSDNEKGAAAFLKDVKDRVNVGAGRIFGAQEPAKDDRLLILSTCVANQGSKRYLAVGRLLEETVFYDNYSVNFGAEPEE